MSNTATTASQAIKLIAPGRAPRNYHARTVRGEGLPHVFGIDGRNLDGNLWHMSLVEPSNSKTWDVPLLQGAPKDRKHLTMVVAPIDMDRPRGKKVVPLLDAESREVRKLQEDIAVFAAWETQTSELLTPEEAADFQRVFLIPASAHSSDTEHSVYRVGSYGALDPANGVLVLTFKVHPGPEDVWEHDLAQWKAHTARTPATAIGKLWGHGRKKMRQRNEEEKPLKEYTTGSRSPEEEDHDVEIWKGDNAERPYEVHVSGFLTGGELEELYRTDKMPTKADVKMMIGEAVERFRSEFPLGENPGRQRNEEKPLKEFTVAEHDVAIYKGGTETYPYEVWFSGVLTGGGFDELYLTRTMPTEEGVKASISEALAKYRSENPGLAQSRSNNPGTPQESATNLVRQLKF